MKRLAWLLGLFICLLGSCPIAEAYGATAEELYPQVVEAEELQSLATNTLSLMMLEAGEGRRYEIESISRLHELRLPEGDYKLEAAVPNGLRFWGNTVVHLTATVDGKVFRRLVCYYKIHLFDQVAVAARLIMPGETVTAGDFRFEEKEIGSAPQKFLTDRAEIIGKVLSRPVQPGQVIQRFMLHKPVIVEAGKQIIILGKSGAAEVRMDGMALDKGREGDVIRVRNLTTKRIVKGKVLDDHTVEVVK